VWLVVGNLLLLLLLLLQGNVGRFLNHACSPNCLVQTVFAGNARWGRHSLAAGS
jgi:hypothetical protein